MANHFDPPERRTSASVADRDFSEPRPETESQPAGRTDGASYDVSVVVPTYCEAENLPVLIPRIDHALKESGLSGEIIVVDDNSPDETRAVCDRLAEQYPVRLEVRLQERGLSTAVIHGMRLAQGDVLLCMDADLSHPPEKIPELVSALRDGETDFVIGSRYVPGASTDEDWGLLRWLNSRVATLLARPLTTARDPMAGFFALSRETFQSAEHLDPVGYKIGLELLVKCGCRRVREIPIHFQDRLHGESKLNFKEQVNYLRHLKRLMEHRYGDFAYGLQFGLVGLSGMLVDLACFALLLRVLPTAASRALAIWAAMTWNFVGNRHVTFSRAERRSLVRQYLSFCASCLAGAVVNMIVSVGLLWSIAFFETYPLLAAVAGIAAGFVLNYVLCRVWVFRLRKHSSGIGNE